MNSLNKLNINKFQFKISIKQNKPINLNSFSPNMTQNIPIDRPVYRNWKSPINEENIDSLKERPNRSNTNNDGEIKSEKNEHNDYIYTDKINSNEQQNVRQRIRRSEERRVEKERK